MKFIRLLVMLLLAASTASAGEKEPTRVRLRK
jgi:hypothetical protein